MAYKEKGKGARARMIGKCVNGVSNFDMYPVWKDEKKKEVYKKKEKDCKINFL